MDKKKPNPATVNPYESKGYKRTGEHSQTNRPNPNLANPYSAKPKPRLG